MENIERVGWEKERDTLKGLNLLANVQLVPKLIGDIATGFLNLIDQVCLVHHIPVSKGYDLL
jgi:hypothetical protein